MSTAHARFLELLAQQGPTFGVTDAIEPIPFKVAVRDIRRRRGRIGDETESGYRALSLVERDGILLWVPSTKVGTMWPVRGDRRWRRAVLATPDSTLRVLTEVSVKVLEPKEYMDALLATDQLLNSHCDLGLQRLTPSPGSTEGELSLLKLDDGSRMTGRTLILLHGTFSSAQALVAELGAIPAGRQLLHDAHAWYDQVVCFDHPTLSVSPLVNAIDLARGLEGTTGEVHVIAHGRGGLVARWWLEVLGHTLSTARIRSIMVGAPLNGTSLVTSDPIQPKLSLLSNLGSFLLAQGQHDPARPRPLSLAAVALLRFVFKGERNQWGLSGEQGQGSGPGIDAAVDLIPGLRGQGPSEDNPELKRLRRSPVPANVKYFGVTAAFDPDSAGWPLWRVLDGMRPKDTEGKPQRIFGGENDLVVDTARMTSLGDLREIEELQTFGSTQGVHHCNYFEQLVTIERIREWLGIPNG